jgi:hypothetical protein
MADNWVQMTTGDDMTDDVYRDLPRELTALLRDPRVVLPGEPETLDRVNQWAQAPAWSNVDAASGAMSFGPSVTAGTVPAPSRATADTAD